MRNQDVLKAMGTVVKGIMKVAGTILIAGIGLAKAYDERYSTGYNNAVEAIMNSDMWSNDKAKAVSALKLNAKPESYLAIIEVAKSSLWSNDKFNLILKICNQEEEA